MNTTEMQFVDYDYWHYLKHLLIAGQSDKPIPEHEQAMLQGLLTVDECFFLEMLCHD